LHAHSLVRVHDDCIAGVEELSYKDKYSDYDWTDLNGLTLMSGFIDAHIHITVPFVFKINFAALTQMNAQLSKIFLIV